MGRPFYPTEADDPDLDWLISNFLYEHPDFVPIENDSLPIILVPHHEQKLTELEELDEEPTRTTK